MKKRFLSILLVLTLLLSGCANPQEPSQLPDSSTESAISPETPDSDELASSVEPSEEPGDADMPNETEPSEDTTDLVEDIPVHDALSLEDYLETLDMLESPVREYGESTAYIQFDEDLMVRILYPEGTVEALNQALDTWVSETVALYQEMADGSSSDGDSGELTVDYSSFVINENLISIKMTGIFDRPYLAHPIDIIATFHANGETGEFLQLDDLFLPGGRDALRRIVIEDAKLQEQDLDEHLLDLWTITSNGLEIILERGDYLPMSAGTVTLQYSYEELGEIVALPGTTVSDTEPSAETPLAETQPVSDVPLESVPFDPAKPMLALTFDDGPSAHTDRLLDVFASHGGKGTFFVVGNVLDHRAETLQRIALEGHEIGGHSWDHRQLTKLGTEDLNLQFLSTRAKIFEITGIDTTIVRPPYGSYNDEVKSIAASHGIVLVNWSVDTLDWKYRDADKVYNSIMQEAKDGAIILCHDLHATTVDAMERAIPDLIAQGYQLVTISQLLSTREEPVTPGSVYNKR